MMKMPDVLTAPDRIGHQQNRLRLRTPAAEASAGLRPADLKIVSFHMGCSLGCSSLPFSSVRRGSHTQPDLWRERS